MIGLKRNHKVLRNYLASFIIVFIIPSLFIIIYFNSYISNVINIKSKNELDSFFTQNYNEIEKRFNSITNLIQGLSFDDHLIKFGNESIIDSDTEIEMSQFVKKVNEISIYNNYIYDVVVYFNKNDIVLTNAGKDGFYNYFNQYKKSMGINPDYIKSLLQKSANIQLVPLNTLKNPDKILMLQSFPILASNPLGSVVLTIDRSILNQLSISDESNSNQNLILINEDVDILASSKNNILPKAEIKKILLNTKNSRSDFNRIQINGKNFLAYSKKSNIGQWWYIYYLPEERLASNISNFRKTMFLVIILYIITGVFISVIFTLLNYNPIKVILNDIINTNKSIKTTQSSLYDINEYDIIKKYIDNLNNEKVSLTMKINGYINEMKNNFFKELISDKIDKDRFITMKETLNIYFDYNNYCYINYTFKPYDDLNSDDINSAFLIINLFEKISDHLGVGYTMSFGKNVRGMLLNLKDDIDIDEINKSLNGLADQIYSKFNKELSIGVGNIYNDISKITDTYKESYEAMRYCSFYGCKIATYKKINEIESFKYFYPEEMLNKLMNFTESGDYINAEIILDSLFEKNFDHEKLSLNNVYKLYYDLMGTLKKVVEKYDLYEEMIQTSGEFNFDEYSDMIQKVKTLFMRSCSNINQVKMNAVKGKTIQIVNFINKYYNDPNLSCNLISEKFDISQTNLSNIIKKYSGLGYSDYVNGLRINAAKELLRSEKLSINDIALKVGYTSGNSFIRVFKNCEGITPGKFKERLNNKSFG